MKTYIFLEGQERKVLAKVDLEVVPRGIYVINGKAYAYTGQPTFIIGLHGGLQKLMQTEITVQEVVK